MVSTVLLNPRHRAAHGGIGLLVVRRGAKPYLDQMRASAPLKLQHAIDSIWQHILSEGLCPRKVFEVIFDTNERLISLHL
jgi:hypothetical protein